ncbi:MAG: hypothetical protein M1831_005264 [Alyxoria varia]|nr:MAG: hypothetical protein M1831_005264 [Alyxoria varia]
MAVNRIKFFQKAIVEAEDLSDLAQVQQLVLGYLSSQDEELDRLQSNKRPGRPPTTGETIIKQFKSAVETEFESGMWMPDLLNNANVNLLRNWNGEWASLATLKYVRVTRSGDSIESAFPPKGAN